MIHNSIDPVMQISLDFRARRPIGEQIYAQLLRLIEDKRLQAEEQLPPVRELAERLKVNFNTVARVYRKLDRAGLISTQQGRGTYILASAAHHDQNPPFSENEFIDQLERFIQAQAQCARLEPEELWEVIKRRRNMIGPDNVHRFRKRKTSRKPGWKPDRINAEIETKVFRITKKR
jgi:GntR family transcriptional regulator